MSPIAIESARAQASPIADRLSMSLPDSLTRDRKQFLLWRFEPDPGGKKPRKIPYYRSGHRRNGTQGSPEDRAQLATFTDALRALENGGYDGVGIAMLPEANLVGVDLDHCYSDGKIDPHRAPIVEGTYAEISPSGTGIRAFYTGSYADRKHLERGIEIFCSKGFLTLTGDRINGHDIIALPPAVKHHLDSVFEAQKTTTGRAERMNSAYDADIVLQRLIERGMVRKDLGGGKFGIECPFVDQHTTGDGTADCVYFVAHTNGYARGNIHCFHAHCADRTQSDFLKAIGIQPGREAATGASETCTPSNKQNSAKKSAVNLVSASQIKPGPVSWIWIGYIAQGKVHIIAGPPGHGKTTLLLALLATLTIGGRWPDGTCAEACNVAIWSGEDDPADTIVPRLLACGADLDKVHIVSGVTEDGEKRSFDPSIDIRLLRKSIQEKKIKMLVIDPIVSAVGGDSHKNAETRRALQPIVDLAADLNCAVFGVTHFTKGTVGRDPVERVTGSLAFGALTRVVTVAMKLPDDGHHPAGARLFARAKSNIGPDGGGFYYFLEVGPIPGYPGITNTRVLWGQAVNGTARELLAKAEALTPNDSKTSEARAWLKEELVNSGREASVLIAEAKKNGITKTTLHRAKDQLKIRPKKGGFTEGWLWSLPVQDSTEGSIQSGVESSSQKITQPLDSVEDSTKIPVSRNLGSNGIFSESAKPPEDSCQWNLRNGPVNTNSYGKFLSEDSKSQDVGIFKSIDGILDDDEVII